MDEALRRGCGFSAGDQVFGAVPPMRGSFAELVSVPLDQAGGLFKTSTRPSLNRRTECVRLYEHSPFR